MSKSKAGYDYTFDCTGNVEVMRTALEISHSGWGESCIIGIAPTNHEVSTKPSTFLAGKVWKGTLLGGWKSRTDIPKLVNKTLMGDLSLDNYITHSFDSLNDVNLSVDALKSGKCLRAIIKIHPNYM
jgi:S-(hydroxymethyl)glutathione dehydrogenase/alcohol dehydrogenase